MAARSSAYAQFYDQSSRLSYCLYIEGWTDDPWDNGSSTSATAHTAAWLYCTFSSTPFTSHWWTKQLYVNGSLISDVYDANPTSSSSWSSCSVGINGTTYNRVYFIGEATNTITYNYNSTSSFEAKVGINFGTTGSYMPQKGSYWATCWPTADALEKTCYFNLNIYDPSGVEQYYGDAGYVEICTDGSNYTTVCNEPISYPLWGSTIYVRNFQPATGLVLNTISGLDSWDGYYGYVTIKGDTEINFYTATATYWNDINAYQLDGSTQNALKFDLTTSDGSSWTDLTNEPDSFIKPYGTTATISNIRSNIAGTHYSSNSVTGDNSDTITWTFNQANYVVHLYTAQDTYTIDYNANGGSGSMTSTTAICGSNVTLSSNTLTRTGYSFSGWSTTSSGDVIYTDGQTVSSLSSTHGDTIVLYAVWEVIPVGTVVLTCTGSTETSLSFAWTGTEETATDYTLYYKGDGSPGTGYSNYTLSGDDSSCTLSSLISGIDYKVYLKATNDADTATSKTLTCSTGIAAPIITEFETSDITDSSCSVAGDGALVVSRNYINGGAMQSASSYGCLSNYFQIRGYFKIDADSNTCILGYGTRAVGGATTTYTWHLDYLAGGTIRFYNYYNGSKYYSSLAFQGVLVLGRWHYFNLYRNGYYMRLTIDDKTAIVSSNLRLYHYGVSYPLYFGNSSNVKFGNYVIYTGADSSSTATITNQVNFTTANSYYLNSLCRTDTTTLPEVEYKYQFTNNGGTTWTSESENNTYNWTGLTEDTEYNMGIKVLAYPVTTNPQATSATGYQTIKTLAQARLWKRIGQTWHQGKILYKKDGLWEKVLKIYFKGSGQWKEGQ